MKITVLKIQSRSYNEFNKKEWSIANKEHFGKSEYWTSKKRFYLKAVEDGKIIGTTDGYIEAGVGYISGLIVEDRRGQGVGKE